MKQIFSGLYVGDDSDYEKVKDKSDWRILRCAKEGSGGHRDLLRYESLGAPKGKNYLSIEKGNTLALNVIDHESPDYYPDKMIDAGVDYIAQSLTGGHKVLVACNQGKSRGPSLALLFLVRNGKLPFHGAFTQFTRLYPEYDPSPGLRAYVKRRIAARR